MAKVTDTHGRETEVTTDRENIDLALQRDSFDGPLMWDNTAVRTALANNYQPGEDTVQTPDGVGLVVETLTETRDIEEGEDLPDRVEASDDSPTYVVVLADGDPPMGLYKASDLEQAELDTDVDPLGTLDEETAAEMAAGDCPDAELGSWSPPESWEEAETPARVIALDAFQSMGADFEGCEEEMDGNVTSPDRFCGAYLDYIFGGYDYWRGDSFLPGD